MTMRSLRAVCLVSPRHDQGLGGPVLGGPEISVRRAAGKPPRSWRSTS